ncbi:NUDIX hydrolase [Aquiflexum gelatinilyticum]|uniref:NUDIX hydrolase n=1 Tax=Aquiflexum gelatinilyticum TaxID=2961943 RepID=A0A9X2P1B3_9BACT|nr:NUDIX hydrolase [Aquiflexum gelatinilyticum]MCR9013629.1 NUDIX hydrolase [Aquiflexum gelatinilyticum]
MSFQIPDCFYRVSVKALVVDSTQRFLLVREENGLWELPGGGLDFGESPQEGLRRELKEEMALEAKFISDHPHYFFSVINPKGQYIVNAVYPTSLFHLEFKPSPECQEIRFFSPSEVFEIKEWMYPNVLEFARLYKIH